MKGFTLLYTVLISSIVLTIGLGAFNLVIGQVILAGNAYQSAVAIYAADSGIECALYWDYNYDPFDPSVPRVFDNNGGTDTIYCFGKSASVGPKPGFTTPEYNIPPFSLTLFNNAVTTVEVSKDENPDGDALDNYTVIHAFGRNTAVESTRTLERVLEDTHESPYN